MVVILFITMATVVVFVVTFWRIVIARVSSAVLDPFPQPFLVDFFDPLCNTVSVYHVIFASVMWAYSA